MRFGTDSIFRLEATWALTKEQLMEAIQKMLDEGLLLVKDGGLYASTAGQIAREKVWRKKGRRHPSLSSDTSEVKDIILALIHSGGDEYEHGAHPNLIDRTLYIYLCDTPQEVTNAALDALVADGYIQRGKHFIDAELLVSAVTPSGLRFYAQQVAPRLGLKPPATILAAVEPSTMPFDELGLPQMQADNLRYRWEEAERCMEARAWMSANIMLGSILEVVLPERLARVKHKAMAAASAPKDRKTKAPFPFERWKLADHIKVAAELGLIDPALTMHANALRETRNLVHPEVQMSEPSNPDGDITAVSKHVVIAVLAALARSKH